MAAVNCGTDYIQSPGKKSPSRRGRARIVGESGKTIMVKLMTSEAVGRELSEIVHMEIALPRWCLFSATVEAVCDISGSSSGSGSLASGINLLAHPGGRLSGGVVARLTPAFPRMMAMEIIR